MLWRQFTTLAAAQSYCDAQTALMNLPVGGITQKWAVPAALTDGTYVVPAYQDATAAPWDNAWTVAGN